MTPEKGRGTRTDCFSNSDVKIAPGMGFRKVTHEAEEEVTEKKDIVEFLKKMGY